MKKKKATWCNVNNCYCAFADGCKKSIPIEWIEEWGWKNGMSESMSLRVMIEDWEKENDNLER